MEKIKITASIVTYHNSFDDLRAAISSFLDTDMDVKLYISDNSSDDKIRELCTDERVEYIYNNSNNGFGYAHNIAIKKAQAENSKYHLVINPDSYYDKGNLEKMIEFMENNL
ncbi:MAG: glycosyltransferase, partial [Cetobacterium sp.]